MSGGTVHVRMRKMEEMGIVKGTTLSMDYSKLGWDLTAFLGIYLERNSLYDEVCAKLKDVPEVVKVHYTTGDYSIFAKIHCKDTKHLRDVLHDKDSKNRRDPSYRNVYFTRREPKSSYQPGNLTRTSMWFLGLPYYYSPGT